MRKKPEEVFTPRSADVNKHMYIPRKELEDKLAQAISGTLHIAIRGDSGTGKSWLFKKVFSDNRVVYLQGNLANASRLGGISDELANLIDREGCSTKTEYAEEKKAELNAGVARGSLSHVGKYRIGQKEPFEGCLEFLRRKASNHPAVLVLDNLEQVFSDEERMKELGNLIVLCDDDRYAKYNVRILIVGASTSLREYFHLTHNHKTVSNRICELPEVSRLTVPQCDLLVERGLVEQLKYTIDDLAQVKKHVSWVTDRIPQMVHDYCLRLSHLAEANKGHVKMSHFPEADRQWFGASLSDTYSVIESHMNVRDRGIRRKDQVLYAIGACEKEQFKPAEIEQSIRLEFPDSTAKVTTNSIAQVLASLARGEDPVIRASPKGKTYEFVDPRYRMAIRAMLQKTPEGRIEKAPLTSR